MSVSNEQLYTAILDLKGDVGEVKAGIVANADHTLAVSKKADGITAKLDTHISDDDAHGLGSARKVEAKIEASSGLSLTKMLAVIAGAELLFHILPMFLKK